MWPELNNFVHGKSRRSKNHSNVKRAKKDIENILKTQMQTETNSRCIQRLKFVQLFINETFWSQQMLLHIHQQLISNWV